MSELIRSGLRASAHAGLANVVFLSPHFDDVALSCGGAAALLQQGEGASVTIFAAPAPAADQLNAYAIHLHERWGEQDFVAANEKRRAEDRCAAQTLGLDLLMMDYGDAPYRGERYNSRDGIFGDIHPDEKDFPAELADQLVALLKQNSFRQDIMLYAPLGVGHHVDHQLTHQAARILQKRGWDVLFYEDYPYARQSNFLNNRLKELGFDPAAQGEERRVYWGYREIDSVITRKIDSISCYASQISSLFADEEDMRRNVRDFAAGTRRQQLDEHIAELQVRGMAPEEIDTWLARENHQRMKRGQLEWRYAERFWRLLDE